MPDRIDQSIQAGQPRRDAGDRESWVVSGNYRGEKVVHQRGVVSLLENVIEEGTLSESLVVQKQLLARKVASERMAEMNKKLLERAQVYMRELPDMGGPEKFMQFLEQIRQGGRQSSRQLMQEAGEFFKDLSHQYAGLSFAREVLEEGGQSELVASLRDAADELMKEHGPEIRAGLNISQTANEFAKQGFGNVQGLRDFYRDTVLNFDNLDDTYRSISENRDLYICSVCGYTCKKRPPEVCPACGAGGRDFIYNEAEMLNTVKFLVKAVGCDLQSRGPSISPVELKHVVDELYQLEVLGNVHKDCFNLLKNVQQQFEMRIESTAQDLMDQVMALRRESFVRGDDVIRDALPSDVKEIVAKIYFLREFLNLIKKIPLKVYDELESREKIIDAAQEALDTAIDIEAKESE
jgi:type III secretion protein W